ncbi:TlpA family protein disulfide reductase [Dyadobacter subterraneus]
MSLFLSSYALAQSAEQIISAVRKSQESIKTISYKIVRHDTLVTGNQRTLTGHVKVRVDTSDHTFGFLFWAKEDSVKSQLVYNGNMSYATNDDQKAYSISTDRSSMKDILYSAGGRMVVTDMVKLDTSGTSGVSISQNKRFYYLTINYPDLTKYDVSKRHKTVTIDKTTMLPVAVRQHQETLDKVQDLTWNIQQIHLNDQELFYDFFNPDFVKTFTLKIPVVSQAHPLMALKGMQAPVFELRSFDNKPITLPETLGKILLLDFWEVWCGPCIESMPKVQHLYEKYKDKGLLVYGIINDISQLESSKKLIRKNPEIHFPMLVGNDTLKKDYQVNAVPEYVLIDRKGKITFIGLGYSENIESEIENVLNEN